MSTYLMRVEILLAEKWFGKFRQRIKRNFRALGVAFEAHANWSIYVEEEVVRCQAATS